MSNLEDAHDDTLHEYLVLGAGPAGLQLGYFLEKVGRDYLILEAGDDPGSFFEYFPRHRTLISINKIHTGYDDPEINLRWDWNSLLCDEADDFRFKSYSREYFPPADAMVSYLREYARRFGLKIRPRTRIARVEKQGDIFRLSTRDGRVFLGARLVVATGVQKPYRPDIPGIELTESYVDVSVDPEDFANQQVLVLGKGNSGFEIADNLIPTAALIHIASPRPVKFAWKTHHVGDLRAVNNNFLDTYQLKSQNAVLDGVIRKIERRADGKYVVSIAYSHADEEHEHLVYDRVISCTGFRFDGSIFDESARPELAIDDRFPRQTSSWESTNVADLFFAGTLMQMRDFKKYTSAFVHGFRYNVKALCRIFEERYHGRSWPRRDLEASTEGLCAAILERVNRSSALWQQFKVLGDLIVLGQDGATYHEELPIDFIHESGMGGEHYFVVNLEFGAASSEQDPFNILRHPAPERADQSFFLHPAVRRYHGSELVAEFHLLEDLCGEWVKEADHEIPLREFLTAQLESVMAAA